MLQGATTTHITQLEAAAGELPLLGHTVIWRLGDTVVSHLLLSSLLHQAGFATHIPDPPSPRVSLKRAITTWIRNRSGLASQQSESAGQRGLIRVVNSGAATHLAFVLVREDVDFAAIGLDYQTQIRFLLDKKTSDLTIFSNLSGSQAWEVEREIRQLWNHEHDILHATDISAAIRACVGDLEAVSLHPRGGVYFIPRGTDKLAELKSLVENLPGSQALFTTIAVADGGKGRLEMARAVQQGLLDEVNALASDLDRMITSSDEETRRQSTVLRRLTEYQAMKAKVSTYSELMGMYQDKLTACLNDLTSRARALLAA